MSAPVRHGGRRALVLLVAALTAVACASDDELTGAAAARSRGAELPQVGETTPAPAAADSSEVNPWLDDARALARVNGRTISLREVRHRIGPAYIKYLEYPDDLEVLVRKTLREEILRYLVTEAAGDAGLGVSEEEMRRIRESSEKRAAAAKSTLEQTIRDLGMTNREWEDQQRRNYLHDKAFTLFTGSNKWALTAEPFSPSVDVYVSPEEVRAYGERHGDLTRVPASAVLRVIDLRTSNFQEGDDLSEEAAWEACSRAVDVVEERLRAGESFADVARDVSQGPEAKSGGLLGPFDPEGYMALPDGARTRLRREYVDWAFAEGRRKGENSKRLKMRFGFLLFHLQDRVDAHVTPIEEWGPRVRAHLERTKMELAFSQVRVDLLEQASVDPDVLKASLLSELRAHLRQVRTELR